MENIDNQENKAKPIEYKFWKDSKMLGMILLIVAVSLQIFAFMNVPVLSTINAYTIGMMMGACSPFFYVFVIYISLTMIFKDSIKLPSWMKLTRMSYWFVAIATTFIVSATGHYQSQSSWTGIGASQFDAMSNWFESFHSKSAWYPLASYGGVIGSFLYSFFAMCVSGIGALVISIILIVLSISILITGTSIGLYRDLIKKRNMDLAKKEIVAESSVDFEQLKEVDNKDNVMDPFDDPFDDPFKED